MPSKALFQGKQRPSGLEFPACEDCNNKTSAADSLIAFFSRIDPYDHHDEDHWKVKEAIKYLRSAESGAPGIIGEILGDENSRDTWFRTQAGLLVPVVETQAGPISRKLLGVWALKLAMAMFHEHVGEPLPTEGGALGMWFLNAGMAIDTAETFLKILPTSSTLRQGSKTSAGQFDYRFNTDNKTIAASLAHFHDNIFFFTLAMKKPETYGFPDRTIKHGVFARPGELVSMMPPTTPLYALANPNRGLA